MKKRICAVVLGLMLVLLATDAFGTATCQYRVATPGARDIAADTTFALAVTGAKAANYLLDVHSLFPSQAPAWFRGNFTITALHADIDSCTHIVYGSLDGVNYVLLDSQEVTGSTLGSSLTYACSTAVAGDISGWSYLLIVVKVYGDASGTAKPAASGTETIWWYDGAGNALLRKVKNAVNVQYVE